MSNKGLWMILISYTSIPWHNIAKSLKSLYIPNQESTLSGQHWRETPKKELLNNNNKNILSWQTDKCHIDLLKLKDKRFTIVLMLQESLDQATTLSPNSIPLLSLSLSHTHTIVSFSLVSSRYHHAPLLQEYIFIARKSSHQNLLLT